MTPGQFTQRIDDVISMLRGEEVLTKAALIALGYTQKRTRVRTGTLRRSETYRVEKSTAFLGTSVGYARFQKEPFLELGLEDAQGDIRDMLKSYGDGLLSQVGG